MVRSGKGSCSDAGAEGSRSSREPLRDDELCSGAIRKGEFDSDGGFGGSKGASGLINSAVAPREDREERRVRDVDDSVRGFSTGRSRSPSWSAFADGGAPSRTESAASAVASSGRIGFAALAGAFELCVRRTEQVTVTFDSSSQRHVERGRLLEGNCEGRKDEAKANVGMLGVCQL